MNYSKFYNKGFVFTSLFLLIGSGFFPNVIELNDSYDCTYYEGLGSITDFMIENNTYVFSSGDAKVRIIFYRDDIFRIWLAIDGNFTDPATEDIIGPLEIPDMFTSLVEFDEYFSIISDKIELCVYKSPLRFELFDRSTGQLIFEEVQPISWEQRYTYQYLSRDEDEYFYGCGMQNGNFSHRDHSVLIEKDYNWNDGGHPNPAPFYMSSNGYGVYRNTWKKGQYDFFDPIVTKHREERFDGFYFYGPSLKKILDGYTFVTGRPFMPPIYALELGDADCYNKDGQTTSDVIKVADGYRNRNLPGGWFLPNDGYGCGYTDLEYVVSELDERGFYTGLWTENGLPNSDWEVSSAGVRVFKLDIAWVFPGYKYAFDASKQAVDAIENNSDARRFVWTTMGWSGTQKYSVMWTGDQIGDWENIRFHIPTLIGSGLSGQAHVTGDIDGIFGGSALTYTRDLQWKAFGSVWMSMSGWARFDKQPWRHGQPFTFFNKIYLDLKMRLTPYLYTYCHEAYETGSPIMRAMVLEYPDDPVTWDATTQYQFMSGEWLLVAPVYEFSWYRDDIYLPEGKWFDYWDGTMYEGPMMLDDYFAPIYKLPVFVRGGAIIPMWPQMLHHREKPKDPITFDIYPYGNSNFSLYEDDGVTRAFNEGAFSKQLISVDSSKEGISDTIITIGSCIGDYDGKPDKRGYIFSVHLDESPVEVLIDDEILDKVNGKYSFDSASEGWYYDAHSKGGIVFIKTDSKSTDVSFKITLDY